MQKKMQEIKRELEGTNFEIESSDAMIVVQHILKFTI